MGGEGYDLVLLGSAEGNMRIDLDQIQEKLQTAGYASVAASLKQVGFHSAMDLLATFAARGQDLREWLSDAQINLDRNLRLQYLAGMGLNDNRSVAIYDQIRRNSRFPEDLLIGTDRRMQTLRLAIEGPATSPAH